MMRTLKTILLPLFVGLGLLALVGILGAGLSLYREAQAVHPALGIAVLVLLAAGLVLLFVVPVVQVVRLPGTLSRPSETSGPHWERFVRRYARRLVRNSTVRNDYAEHESLRKALTQGAEPAVLETEVEGAVAFLDAKAREIIGRHAAAVFASTAVSQSGRLDSLIVISAQLRMVREIAALYYQRPRPRELWGLYANVGAAAFVAGELQDSEVLAVLGAPVTAGISGFIPLSGTDPLVSLLVNSLLDGSANAFLTLRIGALAKRYCGLRLEGDRRAVARSASMEAAGLLAGVVSQGASRIAVMTRKLVLDGAVKGTTRAFQGTTRAVRGVAGLGVDLFERILGLAGKATGIATGERLLLESIRFWESVASPPEPDEQQGSPGSVASS
jgi:hypothetical protein